MPASRPKAAPSIKAARIAVAIRSFCSSFIGFFICPRAKVSIFLQFCKKILRFLSFCLSLRYG